METRPGAPPNLSGFFLWGLTAGTEPVAAEPLCALTVSLSLGNS